MLISVQDPNYPSKITNSIRKKVSASNDATLMDHFWFTNTLLQAYQEKLNVQVINSTGKCLASGLLIDAKVDDSNFTSITLDIQDSNGNVTSLPFNIGKTKEGHVDPQNDEYAYYFTDIEAPVDNYKLRAYK